MSKRPFDGFEVHLVAEHHDPIGSLDYCEPVDDLMELERALSDENVTLFYTVYGHRGWYAESDIFRKHMLEDGGAEAIADFPVYQHAIELAHALADGKPVTDMVIDQTIGLE